MANDITLNAGVGGDTLAAKDISGVKYQRFIEVEPAAGTDVVPMSYPSTTTLLSAVTTTGAGSRAQPKMGKRSYFIVLTGSSGTYSCTVNIEVSNDNSNDLAIYQFVLSGTSTQVDGVTLDERFSYVRGNVTAISGTGATVNLYVSS